MTDLALDRELVMWFAAAVPATETAPAELRARVREIPRTYPRFVVLGGSRYRIGALAIAAALGLALLGLLVVGSGDHLVTPVPSPSALPTTPGATPSAPGPSGPAAEPPRTGMFGTVRDARIVSDSVAWAPTVDALYRTADGGQTWRSVQPVGWSLPWDAAFVDANTAYVPIGDGSTVAATHDGGASWATHVLPVPVGAGVAAFSFTSETSGSVTFYDPAHYDKPDGTGLLVFHTTDGGVSWLGPIRGLQPAFDARMPKVAPAHGDPFLVTTAAKTDAKPFENWFYASEDGGVTWTKYVFPGGPLAPANDLKAVGALTRGPDGHLIVAPDLEGATTAQGIFRNGNDPAQWTAIGQPPAISDGEVQFLTADTWIVTGIGSPSTIESTTDAGASWRAVTSSLSVYARGNVNWVSVDTGLAWSTCAQSIANGCAGSDTGSLWITSDGGATWRGIGR